VMHQRVLAAQSGQIAARCCGCHSSTSTAIRSASMSARCASSGRHRPPAQAHRNFASARRRSHALATGRYSHSALLGPSAAASWSRSSSPT
jgi:hypothetical protein